MRIGICPGSFDPVTLGHMDIISRACKIFDKVIVAVPVNPDKRASFTVEERMEMLRTVTADMENVEVDCVRGLLADYASEKHAAAIVKGLRAISDFEYEFQMALTNKKLNPEFETLFLPTSIEHMFLQLQHGQADCGLRRRYFPFCARVPFRENKSETLPHGRLNAAKNTKGMDFL